MKKFNIKGFTLIELLAVIVILAVIALIATPIIMNVINDSKKGAAKDSMYSYVKAVELAQAKGLKPNSDLLNGTYTTKDGNLMTNTTKVLGVDMKGTKPSDNGTVTLTNGTVTNAKLKFDGYDVTYDGKVATVGGSGTPTPPPSKTYTIGEEVYFDPTGAVTDCNASKIWTPTNTGTTCYKWNVIKDNGSSVEMLLDHNTTAKIAWITKEDYIAAGGTEAEYGDYGNHKYGPLTTIKQLKTDTTNWSKVETLTSADNVTRDANGGSKYTINYSGMKARLIGGQEVANIANLTTWTPTGAGMSISTTPWLYQNTYNNGDNSNYGYWTDTACPSYANYAWYVNSTGGLSDSYVYYAGYSGVRPVVRVLKSNI